MQEMKGQIFLKTLTLMTFKLIQHFTTLTTMQIKIVFFPSTMKNNALTYQKNNGSVCNNSETNSTIFNEKLMANRQEAEQMSALRSLKTNLVMILLVSLSILIILIPSKIWQTYFLIVNSSVLKVLLPIVTTMANFGTVQSFARQFWKIILKTLFIYIVVFNKIMSSL